MMGSQEPVGKQLSEMTLEELWELFPIFLVEPQKRWKSDYAEMESFLRLVLADYQVVQISHIGSTAIEGIWAKDIVDVLLEIARDEGIEAVARKVEQNGFLRMHANEERISLNRGYTKDGFVKPVYHLHIRYEGDNDEIGFRDYLNTHPNEAKEYEKLKLHLWKAYEHDRDAYTDAKAEFVERINGLCR